MNEQYNTKHVELYEPFPFSDNSLRNDREKVYGQIYVDEVTYWDNGESGRIKVSISLVNYKMLNMEYEAIEEDKAGDTPLFFYEFIGKKTFDKDTKNFENPILNITKLNFISGGIDKQLFAFRIIQLGNDEEENLSVIRQYEKQLSFVGSLLFSASPILSHKVIIIVEDSAEKDNKEVYDKLKKTYDTWDSNIEKHCIKDMDVIRQEISKFFSNSVCQCVSIFNVGQANCCYCEFQNKKLFFDIGVSRSSEELNSQLVSSALDEIIKKDVDGVILSHWDLDHILGVCYNQKCLNQKIWFVPDFTNLYKVPRLSIKRLCNYLIKNGKSEICMINTTYSNKTLYDRNGISIYMGEPKAANGINKMNNGGLILRLENNKNILLPGDCENSIIPNDAVKGFYDYYLISHHGSYMSDPRVRSKNGIAYISSGSITGHCIPDNGIVDKYKKVGFQYVHNTKNLKSNNKYLVKL